MDDTRIFEKLEKINDKLDDKLGKIDESLIRQGETLVRLTSTVEEHARRSDSLEKMYNHLDNELQPLKISVNRIQAVNKFVAVYIIPIVAALLSSAHWIFKLF